MSFRRAPAKYKNYIIISRRDRERYNWLLKLSAHIAPYRRLTFAQDLRLSDSIKVIRDYVKGFDLIAFRFREMERLANDGVDQKKSYGKHRISEHFSKGNSRD